MQDFEKLGVFYLGRLYDLAAGRPQSELLLYDSKDLVTHAVCVGMTGSGKTGLCLTLLEEAAIDGIPAIAIDPKGDLGNLLLTFPELRGADFEPWINADDARMAGQTLAEFAGHEAQKWQAGLAEWGQDGARIRRLKGAADVAIYTPGSSAGIPISVLKSFAAPGPAVRADEELLRDCVSAAAASLLGLLGIDADPLQSREHILLATILSQAWQAGQDLDLGSLIRQIQSPPLTQVGVLDLESFFPAKDRFALATQLNNLLASPGFAAWTQGEPLDVGSLLYAPDGRPRISIYSVAHLSDTQRMFAVSLLLNQVLAWTRTQPGTTSLRALIYMDEIFGYFPPVANPPSKQPLLTLLKQARAFGVGVVLATQNPVDLDYKGLSNAGTWFIGRLQTERDKARVLEGLEGAAAGTGRRFDRGQMEQILAGLRSRVFLMNNVHEDAPVTFKVRWTLSYLRGPLSRGQIKQLTETRSASQDAAAAPPPAEAVVSTTAAATNKPPVTSTPTAPPASGADSRPILPPQVPQVFLPIRGRTPPEVQLVYQPMLIGGGRVHYSDTKTKISADEEFCLLVEADDCHLGIDWHLAKHPDISIEDLQQQPEDPARFDTPAAELSKSRSYSSWKRSLSDAIYRTHRLELWKSPSSGDFSEPGESERNFRIRLLQAGREQRDALAEKLREKYASKVAALEERIRRAEQAVQREQEQASQSKLQTAISFGATLLGAFLGRKMISSTSVSKAATAARGVSRSMKESSDVSRARENVDVLKQQLEELEAKFREELVTQDRKLDPLAEKLETITIAPKKSGIEVRLVALAWAPLWQDASGQREPAWE